MHDKSTLLLLLFIRPLKTYGVNESGGGGEEVSCIFDLTAQSGVMLVHVCEHVCMPE